jgi:hypothetical protein
LVWVLIAEHLYSVMKIDFDLVRHENLDADRLIRSDPNLSLFLFFPLFSTLSVLSAYLFDNLSNFCRSIDLFGCTIIFKYAPRVKNCLPLCLIYYCNPNIGYSQSSFRFYIIRYIRDKKFFLRNN